MKSRNALLGLSLLLAMPLAAQEKNYVSEVWVADQGNGKYKNPILYADYSDPDACRVGDDFYIATSTFDWFPGVQIHHSRDLVHWHLLTRPLTRVSQLNMKGNPDSCGVWAPNLTYKDGMFYLVYTDVKRFDGRWKDTHNYLVTATEIDGEWSDPIYLNLSLIHI